MVGSVKEADLLFFLISSTPARGWRGLMFMVEGRVMMQAGILEFSFYSAVCVPGRRPQRNWRELLLTENRAIRVKVSHRRRAADVFAVDVEPSPEGGVCSRQRGGPPSSAATVAAPMATSGRLAPSSSAAAVAAAAVTESSPSYSDGVRRCDPIPSPSICSCATSASRPNLSVH